jgi:hypothetical protein
MVVNVCAMLEQCDGALRFSRRGMGVWPLRVCMTRHTQTSSDPPIRLLFRFTRKSDRVRFRCELQFHPRHSPGWGTRFVRAGHLLISRRFERQDLALEWAHSMRAELEKAMAQVPKVEKRERQLIQQISATDHSGCLSEPPAWLESAAPPKPFPTRAPSGARR